MELTNYKQSLEKPHSVFTGHLQAARADIKRIKREVVAQIDELYARFLS